MSLAKRLASATVQLTASGVVARLLSIVTMPLLTRLLSPDSYGGAAIFATMISIFSVAGICGMGMSYTRTYHAKYPPRAHSVEKFAWRYTLGAGTAAGCVSAMVWWVVVADHFDLPSYLAVFMGIGVVLSIANKMALIRARLNNRYRLMSITIVVSAIVGAAVSIGIAVWWRQDELTLILSMVVGFLIPIVVLGAPNLRVLATASGLTAKQRGEVFKIGLASIVTAPMYWVLSSSDRWFLGYFENAASVGIYAIGYSLAVMGVMVNGSLQSVWFPEASRAYEQDSEAARAQLGRLLEPLVVLLGVVWLAIAAAGGDAVRLLAGPRFQDAAELVPYIAAGIFFYGVHRLANVGMLLKKKLHYAIPWWFGGAALCILLNLSLVPAFGRLGAAYTQALTFAFVASGIVYSSQKLYPLVIRWGRLGLVLAVIFALGVAMHPAWANTPLQSLLIKLPVGLAAALLIFYFTAPNIVLTVAHRVLRLKTIQGIER